MSNSNRKSEPIRHHYIPRFILKPFCFEENHLYYYSKESSSVVVEDIRDVFMVRNLYRDEQNSPENPVYIEEALSGMEREASGVIKTLCNEKKIVLTKSQDDMLKLFFAIMSFRNSHAYEFFNGNHSEQTEAFYSLYQPDSDLGSLWKRNLGYLAECRSTSDVKNHPDIDLPIKIFMQRDTEGILGTYFVVLEKRGSEDFIVGDCYPTVFRDPSAVFSDMFTAIPVSPSRIILLVNGETHTKPERIIKMKKDLVQPPPLSRDMNMIIIPVRKVYERDTKWLNAVMMKDAAYGFVFRDRSHVTIDPGKWFDEYLFV